MNAFLVALLHRPKLVPKVRLKNEQRLSIEIANWLRAESLAGRLNAVWTHVANEGKRSITVANILKAMGLITGASDLFFLWGNGSGIIELKAGKNKETENQLMFFQWCDLSGVRHATCNSLVEVEATLRSWSVICVNK